jgi:uncharacterized protein (TIGR03067 family)
MRHAAVFLLAVLLLAADSPEVANRKDIDRWQGTWRAISMTTDGKPADAAKLAPIKLTVRGTDYHFQNGDFSEHGTYRFDAAKDPKQLDIIVGDGKDKGKVHVTIYRFDGERITLALDGANKTRPGSFESKAGSGQIVEVWERVKP